MTETQAFLAFLTDHYHAALAERPLRELRARAWDRFLQVGLPAHRYMRLADLYAQRSAPSAGGLKVSNAPSSVEILPLDAAMRTYGTFLRGRFGQGLKSEADAFALLNAALCSDGLFIYVPPGVRVEVPLEIHQEADGPLTWKMPRIHLFVGAQAEIRLITGGASGLLNQLIDLSLQEEARVDLVQASFGEPQTWTFDRLRATLKRGASLRAVHVTDGGRLVSRHTQVTLQGEGAEVELRGAWVLSGKAQAHASVRIEHVAPFCRSQQLFKGVLAGHARASFSGMIDVAPEAQKTDAYQMNKNLLLSDRATANTKPELEIRADDVKASHGATIGRLDPDELFYLQARGLDRPSATALLVRGFVRDVAEDAMIPPSLRSALELAIERVCASD